MPPRNIIVIFLSLIVTLVCSATARQLKYAATIAEAMDIVESQHLEAVPRRDLFKSAMNGMMRELDEHSAFIDDSDYKRFRENLNQEFGGIGILVDFDEKENYLSVLSPMYNTPAHRAGMRAGDLIMKVDDVDTLGMKSDDVIPLMKGRPGSDVKLKIRHRNETDPIELTLTREIIPVPSVSGDVRDEKGDWIFTLESNPRIGYIRLSQFGERSTEELKTTLESLNGQIDSLILDFRFNPGGLLESAVEICDMFIDEGVIVSTRGRQGDELDVESATSGMALSPSIPLVVLVNKYSASASEVVAACLQDHGRAVVCGERTYGKGTVQNVIELERNRSVLKLTTASYWRPSGANIHRLSTAKDEDDWGVRPNEGFLIPMDLEAMTKVATYRNFRDLKNLPSAPPPEEAPPPAEDLQLKRAIEYLQPSGEKADAA
jgi:carboxyl-terminal processing protease